MRAIVCREPGKLVLEERPEPSPGLSEALVHIRRIGICGTDFHIFEGSHPFPEYPRVMGMSFRPKRWKRQPPADSKPASLSSSTPNCLAADAMPAA